MFYVTILCIKITNMATERYFEIMPDDLHTEAVSISRFKPYAV